MIRSDLLTIMRFFNTAGPVRPDEHYAIPPLDRAGLGDLLELILREQYFALRAPHRSGRMSVLNALRDCLNDGAAGDIRCVYVNVEPKQDAHNDATPDIRSVLASIAEAARVLGDDFPKTWPDTLEKVGPYVALQHVVGDWCRASPTPLVLLLDNVDILVGDTLLSVLLQLRMGHIDRPTGFPQSVALCGVHDIRHHSFYFGDSTAIPPNPFSMVTKWLRLGDFTKAETYALMEQHTTETKQPFEEAALAEVWEQTQGQPWLVNALCAQACFERKEGRDRTRPVTKADIQAAKEALLVSRPPHFDQLAHKLKDEQVRRVLAPILSGGPALHTVQDLAYARDIGIVDASRPPRIANPIYAEVVLRELGSVVESGLDERAAWYMDDAGQLDMHKLLRAFSTFYGEHAEHWLGRLADYSEAGPQLILQAYLQRIVNGGGRIEREYGIGRGAVDLQVLWPAAPGQPSDLWTRIVVECKALRASGRQSLESTIERGVIQTLRYMAHCNAKEGHLVVFDRREEPRDGDAREPTAHESEEGRVTVWNL